MPLKLAAKTTALPQPQADIFEITDFDTLLESGRVRVYWEARVTGKDAQGRPTETVAVPRRSDTISFDFALTERVPMGKTYYAAIKARLYKAMQEAGHFPSGSVS